jgi:hypothetical protein
MVGTLAVCGKPVNGSNDAYLRSTRRQCHGHAMGYRDTERLHEVLAVLAPPRRFGLLLPALRGPGVPAGGARTLAKLHHPASPGARARRAGEGRATASASVPDRTARRLRRGCWRRWPERALQPPYSSRPRPPPGASEKPRAAPKARAGPATASATSVRRSGRSQPGALRQTRSPRPAHRSTSAPGPGNNSAPASPRPAELIPL